MSYGSLNTDIIGKENRFDKVYFSMSHYNINLFCEVIITIKGTEIFGFSEVIKTKIGGVKAITNIADLNTDTATTSQIAKVINNLLDKLRTSGIIQS